MDTRAALEALLDRVTAGEFDASPMRYTEFHRTLNPFNLSSRDLVGLMQALHDGTAANEIRAMIAQTQEAGA